jgi:outer membrane usher protein
VGAWSVGLLTDRSGDDDDPDITATAAYTANRFIVSAFHREEFAGDGGDSRSTGLRFGTAVAFADGRIAVGRPVDGAFLIAEAHPSLEDRHVLLGHDGQFYAARSDAFGPALGSGYGPYRPARITTDVDNLPIGYDLGSGLVEIEPPYRAGYRVEVGSDAQITVIGTLLDKAGEPLDFVTGIARNTEHQDFPPLQVFTNHSGRFALLGAKPGVYRLEMSGGKVAEVTAPADAIGLVRVGEVTAR